MVYDARGNQNFVNDPLLTQISVDYGNGGPFVGERLFPPVRTRRQTGTYYLFDDRSPLAAEPGSDVRAPGALSPEIPGLSVSTDVFFAVEHSLQIAIPDEEREQVENPLSPDRDGTELLTMRLLYGRERAMHTMVTTAANYAAGHSTTLAGTDQWNDGANSDPIGDMKTGRIALRGNPAFLMEPNVAVIPWNVMSELEDHPDFLERIKYSERGIITQDLIAALFGIPNIIIPGLVENTANLGQTANLDFLWGKDVVLAYVPPRAGMRQLAFAYEFVWPKGGQVQAVTRWREQPRESDVIRVARRYDLKFIAVDGSGLATGGYLIKDAIA